MGDMLDRVLRQGPVYDVHFRLMGDAGICNRCKGTGTVWTGSASKRCPKCIGGVLQPRR
jgi:DnaJ-class molecular chaperone